MCSSVVLAALSSGAGRAEGGDVRLAHLSDPHLRSGPLGSAPAHGLHLALARVLALDPRPDRVVITGDLADRGDPGSYAQLAQLLERYPLPVHLTTGNHDDRAALESAFGGTPHLGDRCRDVVDGDATLVVLDSLDDRPGTDHVSGWLGEEQLAWLDDVLQTRRDRPAVLALHHPPAPIGVPFLDAMRLRDADALAAVVARNPQVVRVLAGHVHRPVTTGFAGTTVTTAPSTFRQSTLTLRAGAPMGYLDEPTAFLLHLVDDGGCISHVVPVSHAGALIGAY
jgi:Icc protein